MGLSQTEAGGLDPPDTDGAVGNTQFVEVVNSALQVFDKTTGAALGSPVSLQQFFRTTLRVYDPRVTFDRPADRWVIVGDTGGPSFPQDQTLTLQHFFIAVSQTADATGPFFVYDCNVSLHDVVALPAQSGTWMDYPELGIGSDTVIVTGNVFEVQQQGSELKTGNACVPACTFFKNEVFAVPKAKLYSGLAFDVPLFLPSSDGTIAPPEVLDGNPSSYLIQSEERPGPQGSNLLHLWALDNAGTTLTTSADVTLGNAYFRPSAAAQPGTNTLLEVAGGRFINASTQIGNSLWQVHTVAERADLGSPTPRFYEIDIATSRVLQSGDFFLSNTSYDFNASIAANEARDVFVTWTATDPANGINPQIRSSGRMASEPAGVIESPGQLVFDSPTFYEGSGKEPDPVRALERCPFPGTEQRACGRWGDYSSVSIDPSNTSVAWIANEIALQPLEWGSSIGEIGFSATSSP